MKAHPDDKWNVILDALTEHRRRLDDDEPWKAYSGILDNEDEYRAALDDAEAYATKRIAFSMGARSRPPS